MANLKSCASAVEATTAKIAVSASPSKLFFSKFDTTEKRIAVSKNLIPIRRATDKSETNVYIFWKKCIGINPAKTDRYVVGLIAAMRSREVRCSDDGVVQFATQMAWPDQNPTHTEQYLRQSARHIAVWAARGQNVTF